MSDDEQPSADPSRRRSKRIQKRPAPEEAAQRPAPKKKRKVSAPKAKTKAKAQKQPLVPQEPGSSSSSSSGPSSIPKPHSRDGSPLTEVSSASEEEIAVIHELQPPEQEEAAGGSTASPTPMTGPPASEMPGSWNGATTASQQRKGKQPESGPSCNLDLAAPKADPLGGFNCPVCFCAPTNATVTPCGHISCGECLFSAIKIAQSKHFGLEPFAARCPVCRTEIPGWNGRGGGVIGLIPKVVYNA
ncbi:hypothetical protein CYLTODRAFT_230546 [Cylindrobasidium torrendii FP15055 ss-10]|uniref:RING-type domain-containing protein n=1 Tax=Cylindrobasidium torrendii FP15055 ss-10 TaxID=1314674 RepID=A0A0D7BFP6_9AGAR|nr:hypothetical protein CYLTODRAFT_230546 [Cylindrobasidium torrendii FP15055 ss-10]